MKYNLGWGNSPSVREAFLSTYHGNMVVFTSEGLSKFDYPSHEGDPELIEITKNIIKRQIGKEYKHILLTNGATGGVVISLRAYKQRGTHFCHTRMAPYYLRYPNMIKTAGLIHYDESWIQEENESVILMDLPSNPTGSMIEIKKELGIPVILDGVYLNRVYTSGNFITPEHDVFVGSYSKLLGVNGLRVGWIATNDDLLYERMKELVTSEYCGIDMAGTDIIKNILFNFDWETFERLAKIKLDNNRESWSKLGKFFGLPVPDVGMFYYAPIDKKCKELLEKSGISWIKGSSLGTNDGFGRFNLGQTNELISKAVKSVLKNDKC